MALAAKLRGKPDYDGELAWADQKVDTIVYLKAFKVEYTRWNI